MATFLNVGRFCGDRLQIVIIATFYSVDSPKILRNHNKSVGFPGASPENPQGKGMNPRRSPRTICFGRTPLDWFSGNILVKGRIADRSLGLFGVEP
jgi:hypothetical protein